MELLLDVIGQHIDRKVRDACGVGDRDRVGINLVDDHVLIRLAIERGPRPVRLRGKYRNWSRWLGGAVLSGGRRIARRRLSLGSGRSAMQDSIGDEPGRHEGNDDIARIGENFLAAHGILRVGISHEPAKQKDEDDQDISQRVGRQSRSGPGDGCGLGRAIALSGTHGV